MNLRRQGGLTHWWAHWGLHWQLLNPGFVMGFIRVELRGGLPNPGNPRMRED